MNENPCSNQQMRVLFEQGFKLLNTSNKPRVIYTTLYAESTEDQTHYFVDAFVREIGAYGYDVVMTFESLQSAPFCLEKFSVRKLIF